MSKRTSLIIVCIISGLFICESITNANDDESILSKIFQRPKRQLNGNNNFDRSIFSGGGRRRPWNRPNNNNNNNVGQQNRPLNGGGSNELIFSSGPSMPQQQQPQQQQSSTTSSSNQPSQLVFINNRPTIATMAPFTGRTTASPGYLSCFSSCRTTSEYNPICGSDQELYQNEQKFNCARSCGADIQIVRQGSCQGLFPMQRG